jgi:hypothetical protein
LTNGIIFRTRKVVGFICDSVLRKDKGWSL